MKITSVNLSIKKWFLLLLFFGITSIAPASVANDDSIEGFEDSRMLLEHHYGPEIADDVTNLLDNHYQQIEEYIAANGFEEFRIPEGGTFPHEFLHAVAFVRIALMPSAERALYFQNLPEALNMSASGFAEIQTLLDLENLRDRVVHWDISIRTLRILRRCDLISDEEWQYVHAALDE